MSPVTNNERDAALWKTQVRERIMKNLEVMIQDAHKAYHSKLSPSATAEARHRLRLEHDHNVQTLKHIAEAEVKTEIEREERERKWSEDATSQWNLSGDQVSEAVVEEQMAILRAIRAEQTGKRVNKPVVHEYNGSVFEQGSSSKPLDTDHQHRRTASASSYSAISATPSIVQVQTIKVETASELEARLRRENQQKQQDAMAQRAEEIKNRKRLEREREWIKSLNEAETMSTSSSNTSSSSDQEIVLPMSEDDLINLMIFHDQQWKCISSLPHLQWVDFPWPFLSFSPPKKYGDITPESVSEYVFAPLSIHHDRAFQKDRLKDMLRRWHPDRFETKYLARISDLQERDQVKEAAGVVARILNDLLGKWNDSEQ